MNYSFKSFAKALAMSSVIVALAGVSSYPLSASPTQDDPYNGSYATDCDEACKPVAFDPYADSRYVAIDKVPRLVGYGCTGAKGPIFANEEDHFPKCKGIEQWR